MPDADQRFFYQVVARQSESKGCKVVERKCLQHSERPVRRGVVVEEKKLLPKIEAIGDSADKSHWPRLEQLCEQGSWMKHCADHNERKANGDRE